MDAHRDTVLDAFPAIDSISDDTLREQVVAAWTDSLDETGWELDAVPWYPPYQETLSLPDERLVPHVNEVIDASVALVEVLAPRLSISLDTVLAGAIVHDVSKLYEFDADGETAIHHLLGHPHFGIYPAARAGLPPEVLHIVVSHSLGTAVEPATIEAEIVCRADKVAFSAIRAQALDDLRE